eukprot:TRINITY_DN45345_c0_g1_i1.p1 TRINITY_DN45345_c0_g1~~TRINITY_DN45345_c0_g1_i1.p1  ORF type:complete len:834 (+),score=251.44 TRINITY_DN45345_c0_g1_i1:170-2671(+)
MFPVEAPKELQLKVSHDVGPHRYAVSLQLRPGDDVQARVLQVFRQGELPACLYKSTLEYAVLAVRDSFLEDAEAASSKGTPTLPGKYSDAIGYPSKARETLLAPFFDRSGDAAAGRLQQRVAAAISKAEQKSATAAAEVLLEVALLEIEERRWPALLCPSSLTRASWLSPAMMPSGGELRPGREATFWYAYDFLLRQRPAFFRTIGTLEESYLKGIRELQGSLKNSIAQLQLRQSQEMEQVRQRAEEHLAGGDGGEEEEEEEGGGDSEAAGSIRKVQDLVGQHVGELDAVNLHWRTEIEEEKVRQKASYCDLVVDFFEQELEQLRQAARSGNQHGNSPRKGAAEPTGGLSQEEAAASSSPSTRRQLSAAELAKPLAPKKASAATGVDDEDDEEACMPLRLGDWSRPGASQRGRVEFSKPELKVRAEARAIFGQRRVFFLLRLLVGDITEVLPEASAGDEGEEDDDEGRFMDNDGAGTQLPPGHVGLRSYGMDHFVAGSGMPISEDMSWPLLWPRPTGDAVAAQAGGAGGAAGIVVGTGPASSSSAGGAITGSGRDAAALGPRGSLSSSQGAPLSTPRGSGMQTQAGAAAAAGGGLAGKSSSLYRSPSLRFWPSPSLSAPVSLSPNAYADRLRGFVIPTPENLKFEATQAVLLREFASRCHRVTDLHFAPLAEQLQAVQKAAGSKPLRCGDYFCTRHSNLGGVVQVAFHLLTGSSEQPASDEVPGALHRALRRIVCDAHRCHVAELTLPLLLLDIGTSESSLPYAVAQRRSENALRALKGALTRLAEDLAPSELPELQVVNLVLPASSAQSISAGIPSVAESTLTFLKNSFQCV